VGRTGRSGRSGLLRLKFSDRSSAATGVGTANESQHQQSIHSSHDFVKSDALEEPQAARRYLFASLSNKRQFF